jgi:hypothetical protein
MGDISQKDEVPNVDQQIPIEMDSQSEELRDEIVEASAIRIDQVIQEPEAGPTVSEEPYAINEGVVDGIGQNVPSAYRHALELLSEEIKRDPTDDDLEWLDDIGQEVQEPDEGLIDSEKPIISDMNLIEEDQEGDVLSVCHQAFDHQSSEIEGELNVKSPSTDLSHEGYEHEAGITSSLENNELELSMVEGSQAVEDLSIGQQAIEPVADELDRPESHDQPDVPTSKPRRPQKKPSNKTVAKQNKKKSTNEGNSKPRKSQKRPSDKVKQISKKEEE